MFVKLLLAFTVIPIFELMLLIEIGRIIGSLPTIGIVVLTGAVGAWLAKREGFATLHQLRTEAANNRVPTNALLDGIFVLLGAVTLITPGIITDLLGFSFLIPSSRRRWRTWLRRRIESWIATGSFQVIRRR